jgi:hypothetical protein
MSLVFVSHAREDRASADRLHRRLEPLGYTVWLDTELKGGQIWWDQILANIAACDVFLAVVSRASLNSVACRREREYAQSLHKPILPIGVEPISQALPRDLSVAHLVDYSAPGEDAAFALAAALRALPPAPPLPQPMPPAPPVPLSYLSDLTDRLAAPDLTRSQQNAILDELEPALRSGDAEERDGALQLLATMRTKDLYADVERRIDHILRLGGDTGGAALPPNGSPYPPGAGRYAPYPQATSAHPAAPFAASASPYPQDAQHPAPGPPPYPQPRYGAPGSPPWQGSAPPSQDPGYPARRTGKGTTSTWVIVLAVVGGGVLLLILLGIFVEFAGLY